MRTGFEHLTDTQLEKQLLDLVRRQCALNAEVVKHLVEVEARRLHLKAAFPSLFAYCVERLGLSEHAAYKRITAARLATKHPKVLVMLAAGEVHLTALVMVASHLTVENHQELLRAVSRKSKREIEKVLAAWFPQPDQPAVLRKLPERTYVAAAPLVASAPDSTPSRAASDEQNAAPRATSIEAPAAPVTPPPVPFQLRASDRPRIAPTAPARYRIQFTASERLRNKLAEAQALLSHRTKPGDVADIVEEALDLLIAQAKQQRFGAGARPRQSDKSEAAERRGHVDQAVTLGCHADAQHAGGPRSRHIPVDAKRQVFDRDAGRCTFTATDGRQCESSVLLQLDHATPFALGGSHAGSNLRLLCAAHNRLLAEQVFGRELVSQHIESRSTRSGASAAP